MKHAGPAALAQLAGLLEELRRRPGLVERKPGVFYRSGQAFLHFHEDPAGLFADIKDGHDWRRLKLPDAAAYGTCLRAADRLLNGGS